MTMRKEAVGLAAVSESPDLSLLLRKGMADFARSAAACVLRAVGLLIALTALVTVLAAASSAQPQHQSALVNDERAQVGKPCHV